MATSDFKPTAFPTPISATCNLLLGDALQYAILASCTGAPPTTANIFQHGCLMYQTDSGTSSPAVYQNLGSIAVPSWSLLESAAGGFTLPIAATDASTTTGNSLAITTSAITTGVVLNLTTGTTITTGNAIAVSSAAAGTGARSLVKVTNSNASSVNTIGIEVANTSTNAAFKSTVGLTSTHFQKQMVLGGVTLWTSDGTDPNGALTGTAGDVCYNGATNKPAYCTGTTVWVNFV